MFKTRITELLGVEYPIVAGTMQWLSRAELVAAVCNAGAFGIIPSATFNSPAELQEEIKKARTLTSNPFGVNVNLFPMARPYSLEDMIDAALDMGVKLIETSGRSPEPYMKKIKRNGVVHMHKCARIRDVIKAEKLGSDAVTIVGLECGGHPSMEEVTSMILIPRAVESVKIPVLAGGGICDAKGFMAALSLGAEGVVIGTRFMATKECQLHQNIKASLLKAEETDTMLIEKSIGSPIRALRNQTAQQVFEMEQKGVTLEDLMPLISGQRGLRAMTYGDPELGVIACGQVVGLIHEELTVKQVIEGIISEARAIAQKLNKLAQ